MRLTLALGMAALLTGAGAPSARAQAQARAHAGTTTIARGAYLGIAAQDIDDERAKALKLKEVRGAEVTSVTTESPAAKAGIKDGDVILEFNGTPVEGTDQLSRMVRETPAGRQVKIGLWRAGAPQTVTATIEPGRGTIAVFSGDGNQFAFPMPKLQEMPNIEIPKFSMMSPTPLLGIFGESIGNQEQLAEFFGVKEGVLVKSVNKGSAAEKAGIKAGDVIVRIDENQVNSTGEITSALRTARSKSTTVNITVVRNKKEMPLSVTLDAPPARPVRAGAILIPGQLVKIAPMKVLQLLPDQRVI